ncbi:hypothetical protein LY76DRAFT_91485 [Colletotrichum caudatum]|nr:hypothetical protein LY76DRAFT_91485 [Colletotrichum caudatum]
MTTRCIGRVSHTIQVSTRRSFPNKVARTRPSCVLTMTLFTSLPVPISSALVSALELEVKLRAFAYDAVSQGSNRHAPQVGERTHVCTLPQQIIKIRTHNPHCHSTRSIFILISAKITSVGRPNGLTCRCRMTLVNHVLVPAGVCLAHFHEACFSQTGHLCPRRMQVGCRQTQTPQPL